MNVGDIVCFEDGQYKNRFGYTKITAKIKELRKGTADIILYGMVGPGDEYIIRYVPLEYIKPIEKETHEKAIRPVHSSCPFVQGL